MKSFTVEKKKGVSKIDTLVIIRYVYHISFKSNFKISLKTNWRLAEKHLYNQGCKKDLHRIG